MLHEEVRVRVQDQEVLLTAYDPMLVGLRGFVPRKLIGPILHEAKVSWSEVVSDCRQHRLSKIRQHIYFVLRQEGWSFPRIGKLMNRDHTTVVAGIQKHITRQQSDS